MSKRNILCVDDEPIILTSLARLFRKEEYGIYTAKNAQEALSILEEVPVDLVISDYRMPEMSGVELLKEIKELYPNAVRIILSGYADFNNVVAAINNGQIYRFCHKPWDNYDLKTTVRQCLEYHDVLKENRILMRRIQKQNLELRANNDFLEKKNKTTHSSMRIYQTILQKLPTPIIAINAKGRVLVANNATHNLLPALRQNTGDIDISTLFNKKTVDYILSLLKLDDSIKMSSVSFKLDEQNFSIQVEQFDLHDEMKGGILTLTPLDPA